MACKYAVAMMDSIAPYPVEKLQKDLIKLEQQRTRQINKNLQLLRLARENHMDHYIQQWSKGVEEQAALEDSARTLHRLLEIRRWYNSLRRRLVA